MSQQYLTLHDADRWVHCSASVGGWEQSETETLPQSPAAAEGTAAHTTLEKLLAGDVDAAQLIGTPAPNNYMIDQDMIDHALRVIPEINALVDDVLYEQKITLTSEKGTRIYGKYDLGGIQAATKTLRLFDYKYGMGVIEPETNYQLIGGALGLLNMLPNAQFDCIELIVIQPRVNHPKGPVRKWTLSLEEFKEWSDFLLDRADIALAMNGDFTPGSWCRYCKKQNGCSALRQAGLHIIDQVEYAAFETMDADALAFERNIVLRNLKVLQEYAKALDMQIIHRLKKGEYIPNLMAKPHMAVKSGTM